jgi:mitotic spindle assembly checkpoint protein MAD2
VSVDRRTGEAPANADDSVKKYGLNMLGILQSYPLKPVQKLTASVSSDDQVKAYIKKIMSQLNKWMQGGKISKLVVVITSKETGEHVERWQFDVRRFDLVALHGHTKLEKVTIFGGKSSKSKSSKKTTDKENAAPESAADAPAEKTEKEIQEEIQSIFRQITASVTFLPMLDGNCTFNVLVYADADSEVPMEWGDSDAKEIKNGEKVQLRSFSTSNHRVDTLVSYRYVIRS